MVFARRFNDDPGSAGEGLLDPAGESGALDAALAGAVVAVERAQIGEVESGQLRRPVLGAGLVEQGQDRRADGRRRRPGRGEATKRGMVGDLAKFTQYQVAQSIPIAAGNEGGLAGVGAGLGAGVAIGQQMAGAMGQAMSGMGQPAQTAPAQAQSSDDVMKTIERLHDLMQKGALTQQEFEAKKADLLKKLA
jgi:hypothetical protein